MSDIKKLYEVRPRPDRITVKSITLSPETGYAFERAIGNAVFSSEYRWFEYLGYVGDKEWLIGLPIESRDDGNRPVAFAPMSEELYMPDDTGGTNWYGGSYGEFGEFENPDLLNSLVDAAERRTS